MSGGGKAPFLFWITEFENYKSRIVSSPLTHYIGKSCLHAKKLSEHLEKNTGEMETSFDISMPEMKEHLCVSSFPGK